MREFGKLVDPIADKIIVAAAFIMLVSLGRAPAWIVALIISREFAVSGLRAFAGTRNIFNLWGFPFVQVGWILLIAAFITTMWSGYEYFADYAATARKTASND